MSKSTTLSKSVFIKASRETVWSFLTDKDKIGLWYHPTQSDLEDGEEYALLNEAEDGSMKTLVWGRVLEMKPPSTLRTTFCIEPFAGGETNLTWSLHEVAGGTKVSLEHEGIAEVAGPVALQLLSALDEGWDKHFAKLREATA